MDRCRETDWWYWLVTDGLLIGSLAGRHRGAWPVIGLTVVQAVHYPVQVRPGYLLLLVLGTLSYPGFIHWIQLACTTAVVMVGYCPLARILAPIPWNRNGPLTAAPVWNIIVAPPVAGSILDMHAGKQMQERVPRCIVRGILLPIPSMIVKACDRHRSAFRHYGSGMTS